MLGLCFTMVLVAFALAVLATALARLIGRRINALDGAGVAGQLKEAPRKVPNTGGLAIFATFAACVLGPLVLVNLGLTDWIESTCPQVGAFIPGLRSTSGQALVVVGCVGVLHVLGVIDDRKPLGPGIKLAAMLVIATVCVITTDSRLLTMLDARVGGAWLSILLTVLWICVVTNAMNFLDNMDGLSGGVGMLCAAFFLIASLVAPVPQWFVGGALAVLVGTLAGFLVFNFPFRERKTESAEETTGGASIFMGDGGSLVIGFLLAFLSVRITYLNPILELGRQAPLNMSGLTPVPSVIQDHGPGWYAALIPLVILAVPLYDFCSVCLIRIRQGKSPFVGDLQHFSHRLVNHGLSRRSAVLVIYGCTMITGIGAIGLPRASGWQAMLIGVQTLAVLAVIALYEWSRLDRSGTDGPSETKAGKGGRRA
jgi:UDP-GlcNAc:undecaprenyl-phosphate GlcNAc-1-phosphate transferase